MSLDELSCRALERQGAQRYVRDVAGLATHWLQAGAGDAALVWLPALGDAASAFGRVMMALAERVNGVARVIAVDPPGYGSSPPLPQHGLPDFETLYAWARKLTEVIEGELILSGNSSGAAMAIAASSSPRTAGSILVAWPDWRHGTQPGTDVLCPADAEGFERLLRLSWHRPPRHPQRVVREVTRRFGSPEYRAHVGSFDAGRYCAELDRRRGRLAFVGGCSDGLVTPSMLETSAAAHPGASLDMIEASGHYPHKEQPDVLVRILEARIREMLA